ncbi:hypothetical protein T484DRAFT_1807467 [Baffinella frigidus]|nr:hypothetical protein T484DRAFT_1807467 [Cryptophyta sp. CCMP2293]
MGRCAASLALPALMLASSAAAFAPPSGAGVLGGLRMQEEQGYTKKQILREEIEAPFRKVRLFLVPASMASAALAAFISATRLVATLSGVKGYDFEETGKNLGLDLLALAGLALILKRDNDGDNQL